MNVKISICIPTCKRPERVIEAINSCLDQTYSPYEIIIGDDTPDNSTKNAIQETFNESDVMIRYNKNNPSLGQVGNVNKLFDCAKGDKLILLHDDDLLLPTALETLVSCFEKHPSIKVAYGKQYIISDDGNILHKGSEKHNKYFYRTKEYEGAKLTSLEAGMVQQFPNNAYLIDTDLAKRIKYKEVGDACDFDFGFRVGESMEKFYFVNTYTSKYRISNDSITKRSMNDAGLTAYLMVKKARVPEKSLKLKSKWLQGRAGVAVGQAIDNKRIEHAIEIFFSRDHFQLIFTPGGIKRLFRILFTKYMYS